MLSDFREKRLSLLIAATPPSSPVHKENSKSIQGCGKCFQQKWFLLWPERASLAKCVYCHGVSPLWKSNKLALLEEAPICPPKDSQRSTDQQVCVLSLPPAGMLITSGAPPPLHALSPSPKSFPMDKNSQKPHLHSPVLLSMSI